MALLVCRAAVHSFTHFSCWSVWKDILYFTRWVPWCPLPGLLFTCFLLPCCTYHCPSGVHAAMAPHLCASLARLQGPVTQPDTNPVVLWKAHADVVNVGSPFTSRKGCLRWASSSQWKGLTADWRFPTEEETLPADCSLDAPPGPVACQPALRVSDGPAPPILHADSLR